MVELLLSPDFTADPNQPVRLDGDRSVWALFLLSIRETHDRESRESGPDYQSLNRAWYIYRLPETGTRWRKISLFVGQESELRIWSDLYRPGRGPFITESRFW